jgi:hypothetical protein
MRTHYHIVVRFKNHGGINGRLVHGRLVYGRPVHRGLIHGRLVHRGLIHRKLIHRGLVHRKLVHRSIVRRSIAAAPASTTAKSEHERKQHYYTKKQTRISSQHIQHPPLS